MYAIRSYYAPFKRGKKTGIVTGINDHTDMRVGGKEISLKQIEAVLDEEPLIPLNLLKLIQWVGQYYLSTSGIALKRNNFV